MPRIQYFLPDRIIFHVRHEGLADADVDNLIRTSAEVASFAGEGVFLHSDAPAVQTFPPPDNGRPHISLVPAQLRSTSDIPTLIEKIFDVTRGAPLTLHGRDGHAHEIRAELISVSPSWLMSAAQHQIGIGGPGAEPEMAPAPIANEWRFTIPQENGPLGVGDDDHGGQDVVVAIIDTAPLAASLERAQAAWPNHPLLQRLGSLVQIAGQPNEPRLVIERLLAALPAGFSAVLNDFCLMDHRYRMADHGLFVAGIINSIAPGARLRLYEVLNQYGVGCLETIAAGLVQALNYKRANPATRVIINCSLMLNVPLNGQFDPNFPFDTTNGPLMNYMCRSLQDVCSQLDLNHMTFVAAAGNDAQPSLRNPAQRVRPPARYPAAFESVIGVGALPRKSSPLPYIYQAASYSNIADEVPMDGYLALGGEPGLQQGVLGIYLDDFLAGSPRAVGDPDLVTYFTNKTGWAWWAGTSFAAPMVTAILARRANRPGHLAPAAGQTLADTDRAELDLVKAAGTSQQQHERVLVVTQG